LVYLVRGETTDISRQLHRPARKGASVTTDEFVPRNRTPDTISGGRLWPTVS
jgi:hypothetical protein